MPEMLVIAHWTLAADREEEVLDVLPRLAEASRSEPGNLGFEIYRGLEDPLEVVLLERYVSRDAFAAHRETSHFRELVLGTAVPLLADRVVQVYDPAES